MSFFSQKAKPIVVLVIQKAMNSTVQTITLTVHLLQEIKYTIPSSRSTPEKIRNVTAVPTAGMVIKVGAKVPIMLPMVLKAPRVPTVLPLSSKLSVVYFTSEGVTVPSRNNGYTKIIIQARNAAHIRKFVLTVTISRADTPRITSFPIKGIAAIHTADIRMRLYSLSGSGSLSALFPPK